MRRTVLRKTPCAMALIGATRRLAEPRPRRVLYFPTAVLVTFGRDRRILMESAQRSIYGVLRAASYRDDLAANRSTHTQSNKPETLERNRAGASDPDLWTLEAIFTSRKNKDGAADNATRELSHVRSGAEDGARPPTLFFFIAQASVARAIVAGAGRECAGNGPAKLL
ncbi:hypothetical protein HPB51_011117 [Rhipicephalus microplus]|uniref:Uncharacterized protein n=1 Tax=Rhipicephalus microplus TaxID=6941 RepID=A0A9J6E018_RHIMP|nr:hypothetical protein HPB51_011117 [Rhipicephalus microplus]